MSYKAIAILAANTTGEWQMITYDWERIVISITTCAAMTLENCASARKDDTGGTSPRFAESLRKEA
jgi:hypothetical protein